MSSSPTFDLLRAEDILNEIRAKSHNSSYKLCEYLEKNSRSKDERTKFSHKIATAESLTGGLIFSTLVDIPYFGFLKYGCFSVYDTDAKRVMLGVKVKDVYTQKCAKEMAEGILRNSNATIGIAVSGNAMAVNKQRDRIGELFIGISTYINENEIVTKTYAINTCNGTAHNQCKLWYDTIENELNLIEILKTTNIDANNYKFLNGYNDFILTAFVSNYIRAKTTHLAFNYALDFMKSVKKLPRFNLSLLQENIENARIDKTIIEYEEKNFVGEECQSIPLYDHKKKLKSSCINSKMNCDSLRNEKTTAVFNTKYVKDSSISNTSPLKKGRSDPLLKRVRSEPLFIKSKTAQTPLFKT
jgi:PncC family amidohydrolase